MSILETSILTAVLGDCMGIPYEFPKKVISIEDTDDVLKSYKLRIGGRYFPTLIERESGSYSDDTQMLLMTLRSLQYKDFVGAMIAELKAFMAYECGAGHATRISCQCLEKDKYPWHQAEDYFKFGGNGVVMRVLPHAFQNEEIEKIMTYVFLNGILTHGSPIALVGAQLYVYYAWCKINCVPFNIEASKKIWGTIHTNPFIDEHHIISDWVDCVPADMNFDKEWNDTVSKMIDLYLNTERSITSIVDSVPICGRQKGAGTWCAIGAILLSECKDVDPLTLLKLTSTLNDADTDTLSCILGGLLGLEGSFGDRLYRGIRDYDYIVSEIESFEEHNGDVDIKFVSVKNLEDRLRKLAIGDSITFNPFGKVTLCSVNELESLSSSTCGYLYRYSTELGQTLTAIQFKRI